MAFERPNRHAKCIRITARLPRILAIVKGGIVFVLANREFPLQSSPGYTYGWDDGIGREICLYVSEKMCYFRKASRTGAEGGGGLHSNLGYCKNTRRAPSFEEKEGMYHLV